MNELSGDIKKDLLHERMFLSKNETEKLYYIQRQIRFVFQSQRNFFE
jgi:hypothetical protein